MKTGKMLGDAAAQRGAACVLVALSQKEVSVWKLIVNDADARCAACSGLA
jgi:hypothetical protein